MDGLKYHIIIDSYWDGLKCMNQSVKQSVQVVLRQQVLLLACTFKAFCLICRLLRGKPGGTLEWHYCSQSCVLQGMIQACLEIFPFFLPHCC